MTRKTWIVLADLLLFTVGSGQVWLSMRLPNGLGLNVSEPGPGLFPALVGGAMAIAAALHLAQDLRTHHESSDFAEGSRIAIVWLVVALAGYILLLPRVGFVIAAFGLLLGTLSIYGMPGRLQRLGTAGAVTAVAYLLFTKGLGVNMPQPSWF